MKKAQGEIWFYIGWKLLKVLSNQQKFFYMQENAYKRHKDALANFNKNYIKTEIFPRILGRKIAEAEEIRHASDYDDFYIATREEAEEQIDTAVELVEKIEEYVLKEMG